MRALQRCDFCDAEAVGTFEVVPPELEPTDDEQRRVVLCVDCSSQLETLLEPLLDRLGADGEDSDVSAASDAAVASTDDSSPARTATTNPNATVSGAEDEDPDDGRPALDGDDRPDFDFDDNRPAPDSDDNRPAPDGDDESPIDGITVEHDEPGAETDPVPETDSGPETAADETTPNTSEPAADGDDTVSETTSTADAAASGADATTTRPPKAYSNVVRLLRNREFPMERTAVEALAASAYDLETHEVEAIVDHAIEDGTFVENGGLLRRP